MDERKFAHFIRLILSSYVWTAIKKITSRFYPKQIENWVVVEKVPLCLPRLAPSFDGYRIVQISDFHIGTWLDNPRLDQAIDEVNRLQPDLVAITGDFFTYAPERFIPDLVKSLRRLTPRDASVAVLGNHDHWTDPRRIRQALTAAGVLDLSNTVYTLQRGPDCLHIAGVDDYMNDLDDLEAVLKQLPAQGAAVLLSHAPDFADHSAATGRFDLQISGHSHGGQVRLPKVGPPFLPSFARKYPLGMYQVGKMIQYTNRGLGTAEVPVRYNCPAEITVFTLGSGKSKA